MNHSCESPGPALTVNCVLFGLDVGDSDLKILLSERALEPFQGKWAIPGGRVRSGESIDDAARRHLFEETGVRDLFLEQLYTFGAPDRDPREHVVSVSYIALVNINEHNEEADTETGSTAWFSIDDRPQNLAFDHAKMFEIALDRLRKKLRYEPVGFELLPEKFTLTQLQRLYETVWERQLDKRNFRKKVLGLGVLQDLGEIQKDVTHRAARLYSFNERAYRRLKRDGGFHFEIR